MSVDAQSLRAITLLFVHEAVAHCYARVPSIKWEFGVLTDLSFKGHKTTNAFLGGARLLSNRKETK